MLAYLHGLNSSGRSHKAGVLRRALAPRPVLAPDYQPTARPRRWPRCSPGSTGSRPQPPVILA
jgi:predicted esterase YcpF (UPF0227 family)